MRYVILRDDDTNALTPIDCLERLYRPFLDRGLPVNLATIPDVSMGATTPKGEIEGFLWKRTKPEAGTVPIGDNPELVNYLLKNKGYQIVQHGLHHDYYEFERKDRDEVARRFDRGTKLLVDAGFPKPQTFVAPHDKFSRVSLAEAALRFPVLSSGWYERGRLPFTWWPKYLWKKMTGAPHWRIGRTTLLSHPGCLLSCHRSRETMLHEIKQAVQRSPVTVLVTHWWEYFRNSIPDEGFIQQLHETASYLANAPAIKVISFSELARTKS